MRRWGQSAITGIVTAACGAAFALMPLSANFEESIGLWWLFTVRGAIQPPPDPVIVAIDGTTGADLQLSKLPRDWPRTIHAQLVDRLVEEEVAVIVFDMDFSRVKRATRTRSWRRRSRKPTGWCCSSGSSARRQPLESGADGKPAAGPGSRKSSRPLPCSPTAADRAGAFPLPKLGRSAIQFWTFKPSTGDAADDRGGRAAALCHAAIRAFGHGAPKPTGVQGLDLMPAVPGATDAPDPVRWMVALRNRLSSDQSYANGSRL